MKGEEWMENLGDACLFVYGTLRKGFRSHGLLQRLRARFVATGYVRGLLYDLGEYPGAVEKRDERNRAFGEVYWLPDAAQAFKVLDQFEGFDPARRSSNLFERKKTTVVLAGGGAMSAWIYWLARPHQSARRVPSGDYSKYRK